MSPGGRGSVGSRCKNLPAVIDAITKLVARLVEKPWGQTRLPPVFGDTGGRCIGEVWFEGAGELPLLAKYLFTSERLSIQDHPGETEAKARGLKSGKEECWLVLDAEPGATLGLGPRRAVGRDELRAAALDGSIVELIDWKPVSAGDFYYVPPGTVHAIGAGISLLEFQQNSDVTYRLYDYGRPRELHLDEGLSVAILQPYADARAGRVDARQSSILASGPPFALVHAVGGGGSEKLIDRRRWVLPLDGEVRAGALEANPGECLLVEAGVELTIGWRALIGAEGEMAGSETA
jgi:mannose-6-phosphate isomerase